MKRIAIIFGVLSLAALLFGCGGGSSVTPDNNDNSSSVFTPQAPDSVTGDHSVSIVPDRLNVLTGATGADLEQLAAKYGCAVLSQTGGWATLELPAGSDLTAMAATLEKEYNIARAEPVHLINTPRAMYADQTVRTSSRVPFDPYFGDRLLSIGFFDTDGDSTPDTWGFGTYIGQAQQMTAMGFTGTWDVQGDASVQAEPVRIAIIDAGWFDYSTVNRPGLDETILDDQHSGSIDGTGTLTPGLTEAVWELDSDGDDTTRDFPWRDTGDRLLGIMAASLDDYFPQGIDFDAINGGTADGIQEDEVWNEGIAGINPSATYVLIKTGSLNIDTWAFSDNELAAAIEYAAADTGDTNGGAWPNGGADADIVLVGCFGLGPVAGSVSTAIQTARDNNVLVIAPAGDVVDSFNGTGFDDTPVDIGTTDVTPASDPNCVSVAGVGFNKVSGLPDVDFGDGAIPNDAVGWTPAFTAPFDSAFNDIATYCNTGATIAASSYAVSFGAHPFLQTGAGTAGDPTVIFPGDTFTLQVANFGSAQAAAYVAGAASVVFQALSSANGTPPTDDEVLAELLNTAQFVPMAGLQGNSGLLNAGAAAFSGIQGGGLQTVLPALQIQFPIILSQPQAAVTRATDFSATINVVNGTAPFTLEVDWGNGDGPQTVDPWTNGDPVTLTGGYDTLGLKPVNITITDSNDLEVTAAFQLMVINPLGMGITITDVAGNFLGGNPVPLTANTQYRFNANPTNVYTGDIGGTPNDMTISWDFTTDGTDDATGVSPVFSYTGTGSQTITVTVTETVRPDTQWTINVNVS
jgi:hypothetical protein